MAIYKLVILIMYMLKFDFFFFILFINLFFFFGGGGGGGVNWLITD